MTLATLSRTIRALPAERAFGRLDGVQGLLLKVGGLPPLTPVGAQVEFPRRRGDPARAEILGFENGSALCLPFEHADGVEVGGRALLRAASAEIAPSHAWLGRVVNGFGKPIDGKGSLTSDIASRPVRSVPPPAHLRGRVGEKIDLGVRALDVFAPCCRGQRLGLFAGSGVGKSVLLSMLARYADCDVAVIGLIGERGREVQEFLEDTLGEAGIRRTIVVVATSDEPALMRRQAAFTTLAIAEHFRDQGAHVLCLMDSVTRFAMAQREIGLASGEPPTTRGYTPTVFSELPKLLERAGPGERGSGSITGLFTVLVDGDDHNEPVADAVRGILDGHIVMTRRIAERGRFPAIDVLKSVSRTLPAAHSDDENRLMLEARRHLALYSDMEEMIRLGAYRIGTRPDIDRAIELMPGIDTFLSQSPHDRTPGAEAFLRLQQILSGPQEDEAR